jgi:hypothetical protein
MTAVSNSDQDTSSNNTIRDSRFSSNALVSQNRLNYDTLKTFIQTALELGELSPGMEAQIEYWIRQGSLSEREQELLKILHDALQEGCIRRSADIF